VWDVTVGAAGMGYTLTEPVNATGMPAQPALIDGRPVVAFPTKRDTLAVDIGQWVRTVVGDARPTVDDVHIVPDGNAADLTVRLPRVHVRGTASLDGELLLGTTAFPARLRADHTGATLGSRITSPDRPVEISLRFLDRESRVDLILNADPDSGVVATQAPRMALPALSQALRRLRDRVRLRSRVRRLVGRTRRR
jgi:hypothetical protein